jgi:hypothetical protein
MNEMKTQLITTNEERDSPGRGTLAVTSVERPLLAVEMHPY